MTFWLAAALVLLVAGVGPLLVRVARGSAVERLAALDLFGVVTCLLVVVLARALARPGYVDVALVLAPLALAGCLVFTRLLARTR